MIGISFWICVILILYVYAGYPILAFLLARLRLQAPSYSAIAPPVTLLIAAYNEEKVIREKLENSLALDYPRENLQILVADDGSQDRTADIVRSFAGLGVELSSDPVRQGKLSAINRTMSQVRHEIVVFSDANNFYAADAIREIVKPFSDPAVGAVSGSRVVAFGENNAQLGQAEGVYWRYESFIKKNESRLGSCIGVSGEQLALRRELYSSPPAGIINEDFYIALQVLRRGYNVIYAPLARSRENVSANPGDEVARKSRIVAGRYQIMARSLPLLPFRRPLVVWQIVSHKYLRPLAPFFMIAALLTNIAAALTGGTGAGHPWLTLQPPVSVILLAGQLTFYLLAGLGNALNLKGWLGKILYLPAYLVVSNYAALLGLARYLSGRQTVLWKKVGR